jgi:uncharacterized protein (DUF58 family)
VKKRIQRYQILLLLSFLSGMYALATGFLIFTYLTVFLLLVLFIGFVWSRLLLRGIIVEADKRILNMRVGELLNGYIRVRNESIFSKQALEIREISDEHTLQSGRVIDMSPNSIQGWKTKVSPGRRGIFSMGPIEIAGSDLFGLFRVRKIVSDYQYVTVWPNTYDLPLYYPPMVGKTGVSLTLNPTYQSTPNISHVREYIPGDSLGKIHWASTAKTGELMVKQFDDEVGADQWVIVDLDSDVHYEGSNFSTVEISITVAASICKRLTDLMLPVGLIVSGLSPQVVPVERGYEHLSNIMNSLSISDISEDVDLLNLIQKLPQSIYARGNLLIITPSPDIQWVNFLSLDPNLMRATTIIFIANDNDSAIDDFSEAKLTLSKRGITSYILSADRSLGQLLTSIL